VKQIQILECEEAPLHKRKAPFIENLLTTVLRVFANKSKTEVRWGGIGLLQTLQFLYYCTKSSPEVRAVLVLISDKVLEDILLAPIRFDL